MKLQLKSLRRREPNVYDVELEDERGEARVFTFRHSAGTVDGLIWGDDFAEYMLENVEARPRVVRRRLRVSSGEAADADS